LIEKDYIGKVQKHEQKASDTTALTWCYLTP